MTHWLRSYALFLKWTVLKLRADIPVFLTIQTLMSTGIVLGFSLLIPTVDAESALYLTTGAITFSLISVGMVIAPQIIAVHKVRGLLDYERTIPVPRMAMLAADGTVWIGITLPGVIVTLGIATLRFELNVSVSPMVVPAALLVIIGAAAVGYGVVYLVRPVMVGLVGNVVMIIALMFAPINFPADRLPSWAANVHEWLPFQYMAQAVRETIDVPSSGIPVLPFVVLFSWAIGGLAIAARVMTIRL